MKKAIVVGGGISGLATAYLLGCRPFFQTQNLVIIGVRHRYPFHFMCSM